MKNLISMTYFLEKNLKTGCLVTQLQIIHKYKDFLQQPLELWMFVPCDEDGNVLEVPKYYGEKYTDDIPEKELILHEEFVQAKERCLFDGFKINDDELSICDENSIIHLFWNYVGKWNIAHGIKTIEDLVTYNLELTTNAQKQLKEQ